MISILFQIKEQRLRNLLSAAALVPLLLASCTQTMSTEEDLATPPTPKAGEALITGPAIVSVNSQSVESAEQGITVSTGQTVVEVQPPFRDYGSTRLTFSARSGQSYELEMKEFPELYIPNAENNQGGRHANNIAGDAEGAVYLLPVVAGVSLTETALAIGSDVTGIPTRLPKADYVDLMIVSKDPREGIVSKARLHPESNGE